MKTAILTLTPIHTNYGNILQAYALQTVLQRLGHEPYVLEKVPGFTLPLYRYPLAYAKRLVLKYLLGKKQTILFLEQKLRREYKVIGQFTHPFVQNISIPIMALGLQKP